MRILLVLLLGLALAGCSGGGGGGGPTAGGGSSAGTPGPSPSPSPSPAASPSPSPSPSPVVREIGLLVGFDQELLQTEDGGTLWNVRRQGMSGSLYDVDLVPTGTGWAVGGVSGGGGVILRTADFGRTFTEATLPSLGAPVYLAGVAPSPTSAAVVLACGYPGLVLRSADGGQTWTTVRTSAGQYLSEVAWADGQIAFVFGWNGEVLRSQDAGLTWADATGLGVTLGPSVEVRFPSPAEGWLAGMALRRTVDGGATWQAFNPGAAGLPSLSFPDTLNGFVGGGETVRATADGGATWTPRNLPAGATAVDLDFLDAQTGWAAQSQASTIYRTRSGGGTWTALNLPSTTSRRAVFRIRFLRVAF